MQPSAAPPSTAAIAPASPPKRLATADLVGRSAADISRLFGQPRLLRREAPAEVWQFPGSACTLLVFLYPDDGAPAPGALRVQHADAVPPARGVTVGNEDCVESLMRLRPPPMS